MVSVFETMAQYSILKWYFVTTTSDLYYFGLWYLLNIQKYQWNYLLGIICVFLGYFLIGLALSIITGHPTCLQDYYFVKHDINTKWTIWSLGLPPYTKIIINIYPGNIDVTNFKINTNNKGKKIRDN